MRRYYFCFMLKLLFYLCLLFIPANYMSTRSSGKYELPEPALNSIAPECRALYQDMGLEKEINYIAFEKAYTGFKKIDKENKGIITLIDFTKPSTEERLYVLDIKHKRLLFSSLVSHGKNSGNNYATSFSNENGSYKSSLGFYTTGNTYQGRNGYSLVLNGLEKGINDKAKERAIVIHGANYANPSAISSGRLGRSFGCPALPQSLCKPIINTIKGGTVLFIYAEDPKYLSQSSYLSSGNPAS